MRISDWSSDVCSSDLLPLSLLVAEIRPSLIAFRMADLERPTRSAASFGPMEVLLTIAHLVLCTAYRMERGGVQLIGLLYSWRSEERRVGKEWFSRCRSGWSPYH